VLSLFLFVTQNPSSTNEGESKLILS